MIAWRAGVVTECRARWDGACESTVALDGEDRTVRALSYPHLVGEVVPGAHVLLNATALLRGLGTGGYALVVARTDALVPDPLPGPGHLVKARYTPLQAMVLGVDDQESPHHDVLRDADDLDGLPVVVADLHSALPAVVAGARAAAERLGRPAPRVAYVMTDGGALPAWFSRAVDGLRSAGWVEACVTTGQAFGGDLEAVTVHTGLLAAHHVVGADLVVVAQGPGNLGTGTRWGFSGVAAGEALNAAGVLGGRPVASLRVSGADARDRHLGVSHHSSTAYGRVALSPADVVVPRFAAELPGTPQDLTADPDAASWAALTDRVRDQAAELVAPRGRHTAVTVDADDALLDALRTSPVRLSTMGRGLDADPAAFLAAAVAGVHAVMSS
ncbi:DUF3866 family protein [Cellulomonas wangsupingiae]|uniref:DUF3866 family protein n=1 Tax=Cellulomonas wangsupingiae TaxID=2968085 RepID=A0ABY5JZ45_9CELL|nr:DUF3866 family protein [Cellulomonas wangsupingiae]MCC2333243.1 DUF3866 family protein [Cellulomonas wangsupingiae]MCM0638096.1 DUF3866 family protein [Cellulomonas wangsupingiae]UUI63452.1 DUF3866 family protein [Cellulomonas wangsupingiae]